MDRASRWRVMRRVAPVAGLVEPEVLEVLVAVKVAGSSDPMLRPLHQVWHHQRLLLLARPHQKQRRKIANRPTLKAKLAMQPRRN